MGRVDASAAATGAALARILLLSGGGSVGDGAGAVNEAHADEENGSVTSMPCRCANRASSSSEMWRRPSRDAMTVRKRARMVAPTSWASCSSSSGRGRRSASSKMRDAGDSVHAFNEYETVTPSRSSGTENSCRTIAGMCSMSPGARTTRTSGGHRSRSTVAATCRDCGDMCGASGRTDWQDEERLCRRACDHRAASLCPTTCMKTLSYAS
mmetsp:Transcript_1720/g.5538  ORF Transcript_1720/g.5538 Transcript_1720/m.5538 type:complete len:211 (+) Transcript_1720:175-807(+)